MKKFIILIPIFNDRESLTKLIEDINFEIKDLTSQISIIVVNDASSQQITDNYPNTEKYRSSHRTQDDWSELMKVEATLTSIGNIRNKDHLIGETKDFYEWTRIFTPSQCRKLEFATN